MSGTVCKEQTKKCKCIVKERIIDDGGDKGGKDCSAMYKQLGNSIQQCLMEKSRKNKDSDDKC